LPMTPGFWLYRTIGWLALPMHSTKAILEKGVI
jgi:hypothetical protein